MLHHRCPRSRCGTAMFCVVFTCVAAGLIAAAWDDREQRIGPIKRPPLVEAALQGNVDALKERLARGDNIDLRDSFGATALTTAAWAGNAEIVKLLVSRGANANAADRIGNTALMGAAVGDERGMAAVLLKASARIAAENKDGHTALTLAAEAGSDQVIALLAKHGARLDASTAGDRIALLAASASGQPSAVTALLDGGADINVTSRRGETALMVAADNWRTDVVRLLLARGADRSLRNTDGRTALDIAKERKRPDIVSLLEKLPATKPSPGKADPVANAQQERERGAPQVINSNIDASDMAVDPGLTELMLTFDRPMNTRRYHLIPAPKARLGQFPQLVGDEPTFFRDERTYVLRVKLEPGTRYAFGMNDVLRPEFRSAHGVPMEPIIFYFRTAALDQETPKKRLVLKDSGTKGTADIVDLFRRLIDEPTKENYLAARSIVILHPSYNPYTSPEMNELASARSEDECRRALKQFDAASPNSYFSPRAHAFAALAAKKLGDEKRWEAEVRAARQLVEAIARTGDGSEASPYIITRLSDEDDVLKYLGKEKVSRYSADGKTGFCDVFRCMDGSSVWFKIPPYQR